MIEFSTLLIIRQNPCRPSPTIRMDDGIDLTKVEGETQRQRATGADSTYNTANRLRGGQQCIADAFC